MVALTVVAMLSACSKRGAGIGVGVGLGIAAVGGIVASNPGGNPANAMGAAFLGIDLAVLGGVVVLGSLAGLAIGPRPNASGARPWKRNATVESAAANAEQARRLHAAHDLVSAARAAALIDDCATALKIGAQVYDLDRETYDIVFMSGFSIMRCFETP